MEANLKQVHADLQKTQAEIARLQVDIAKLNVDDLKLQVVENRTVIRDLEAYRNKMFGALIIINVIWAVIAGVGGALMVNYLK